jgi:hypothetical protein
MIFRNIKIELVKKGSKRRFRPLPGQDVPDKYVKAPRKMRDQYQVGQQFCVDLELRLDSLGRSHLILREGEVLNQTKLFL